MIKKKKHFWHQFQSNYFDQAWIYKISLQIEISKWRKIENIIYI